MPRAPECQLAAVIPAGVCHCLLRPVVGLVLIAHLNCLGPHQHEVIRRSHQCHQTAPGANRRRRTTRCNGPCH